MPGHVPSRASGLNDPGESLSFSGAVVAQSSAATLAVDVLIQPRPQAAAPSPDAAGGVLQEQPQAVSSQAASEEELARPECDTSQSDLFCVYEIQSGDTLSGIAQKFGIQGNENVAPWEILVASNKPDIASADDILQPGQKLRIPTAASALEEAAAAAAADNQQPSRPAAASVIHTVLKAQTLSEIAAIYGVSVEDIVRANRLSDPDRLQIGDELLIPNPTQIREPPAAAPPAGGGRTGGGQRSTSGLIWPVTGPISSYLGPGHPLGIDIDLYANPNAPIGAAMAGTVTFAGGNPCCSYGLYVIVDHGNGMQTVYAHLSKIVVSVGERVAQGEVLGYGGRTGYATGNHLHFEVHVNGAIVNPLDYLP